MLLVFVFHFTDINNCTFNKALRNDMLIFTIYFLTWKHLHQRII